MGINAKEELLDILKEINKTIDDIKDVAVIYDTESWGDSKTGKVYISIEQLDFNYDSGYGGQELFGFVLFDDGTWLERAEYDGSEWWEYKDINSVKLNIKKIKEGEYKD